MDRDLERIPVLCFGVVISILLNVMIWAIFCTAQEPIRVVDGDTIEIGEQKHRLWGIDTPESKQMCGELKCGIVATMYLKDAVKDAKEVRCESKGKERYGRDISVCYADGLNLNLLLVSVGYAEVYPSTPAAELKPYKIARNLAVKYRLGFWAWDMQEPKEWRKDDKITKKEKKAAKKLKKEEL